jgi:hypothetical protein
MTLTCKKISKEVKTCSNVAETSEAGYGSKGAVLPMMTNDWYVSCLSFVNFDLFIQRSGET